MYTCFDIAMVFINILPGCGEISTSVTAKLIGMPELFMSQSTFSYVTGH